MTREPSRHLCISPPTANTVRLHDYIYTRVDNPTRRRLETALAAIEGREAALLFASGVAARAEDSRYEAGKCSGAWAKVPAQQRTGIGGWGYIAGPQGVDSIIVGFYRGFDLIYEARVRARFVPATRRQVFVKLQALQMPACPFVNLPEAEKGRWGTGLTADDMKKSVWVRPEVVARIE